MIKTKEIVEENQKLIIESSYERGSNENQNRLIRRFLPKRTKNTTQKREAFIENWINNYPKKIFNYKTPFEVFSIG